MSLVPATTGRLRRIAVRGLGALRGAHGEAVYLWQKSLTVPQAPPRASTPAGHGQRPDPPRPPATTAS